MLKTLVEHWPYNPANRGYIPVHKPEPHSPSTQVFTSLYRRYPPGPGIFPYPPVGVELPWAASPHKGKGSVERFVARAIGSGCSYCCLFFLFDRRTVFAACQAHCTTSTIPTASSSRPTSFSKGRERDAVPDTVRGTHVSHLEIFEIPPFSFPVAAGSSSRLTMAPRAALETTGSASVLKHSACSPSANRTNS